MARRGECAAAITALERSRQLFPDDRTLPHVLSRLLATCDMEAVDASRAPELAKRSSSGTS
ncbi:MAG: hypothetical protein GY719_25530 [bacterium]|nr:hypothetical protein [bacterium]